MPIDRHIQIILSFLILTFSCSQFENKNAGQSEAQRLAQSILFGEISKAGCSVSQIEPIANSLSYVIPKRTKYDISSCEMKELSNLSLAANTDYLVPGISGNSTESDFATAENSVLAISEGGTNIEVSFTLESGGNLDIFAYGSGSGSSLTGPAFRVSTVQIEEFYSEMANDFTTVSKGTSPLSSGVGYTYCVDFQYSGSQQWINAWPKECAKVSQSERSSMMMFPIMQMMDVPSFLGTKVGFILNGATLKSFTIGSILSQVD